MASQLQFRALPDNLLGVLGTPLALTRDGSIAVGNHITLGGRLRIGGTTNAFPALRANVASLEAVVADNADYISVRG